MAKLDTGFSLGWVALCVSMAAGCGASSNDPPDPCEEAGGQLAVAADWEEVDRVSIGAAARPDGVQDMVFETAIAGPIASVVLVTSDETGQTCCGQQWDTLVDDQQVPTSIGSFYERGGDTWVLGIEQDGELLNEEGGALPEIDADCSALRLVAGLPPMTLDGLSLRVHVVRPDGSVEAGGFVAYPE